jgi:hypothetical protein
MVGLPVPLSTVRFGTLPGLAWALCVALIERLRPLSLVHYVSLSSFVFLVPSLISDPPVWFPPHLNPCTHAPRTALFPPQAYLSGYRYFLLIIFAFLVMFSFAATEWIAWVSCALFCRRIPLSSRFRFVTLTRHRSLIPWQTAVTSMFGFMIIVDFVFMNGGNAFVYDPDYKVGRGRGSVPSSAPLHELVVRTVAAHAGFLSSFPVVQNFARRIDPKY